MQMHDYVIYPALVNAAINERQKFRQSHVLSVPVIFSISYCVLVKLSQRSNFKGATVQSFA